jgi:hypothetical protein
MNGKRLSLAAVFFLSVFAVWGIESCSKSNSSSTQSNGTLTATVNGAAYAAKSYVIAGYLTGQIIVQGDSIRGTDTTGIQLDIPYIPAVNTPLYTDSVQFASVTYLSPGKVYDAFFALGQSHAVITLTIADTVNHRVGGTFSGVLYSVVNGNFNPSDSVVITNGAFTSTYQVP